ncbi:MAG: hypothetical protein QNI98_00355 [Woeseiaceae bacterium]|nr:hypothetical protein [Woeseiaceae bacterium]
MRLLLIASFLLLAGQAVAQPVLDESDPLIASVIVYSASYSIERWEGYCASEFPSTAGAVKAARETWMDRHLDLLTKAGNILKSQLSHDERVQIGVQARLTNDELEKKLNAAPMGSRKDWCDQSPQRINAPEMNLLRRAVLVNAIESLAP